VSFAAWFMPTVPMGFMWLPSMVISGDRFQLPKVTDDLRH